MPFDGATGTHGEGDSAAGCDVMGESNVQGVPPADREPGRQLGASGGVDDQRIIPHERGAGGQQRLAPVAKDADDGNLVSVDGVLGLCGASREIPSEEMYERATCTLLNKDVATTGRRSSMWNLVELFQSPGDKDGNLVALCILCHRLQDTEKDCLTFLRKGNNSNGIKHFEWAAAKDLSTTKQLSHARAVVHFLKNVAGGNRSKRLNPDNSIDRFVNKDRRADNLRFVTMQEMTLSPHSLAANQYVRALLAPLTKYIPLSHDTVVKLLLEIYTHLINCARTKFQAAKKRMRGLPFIHVVTDPWTDKHTTKSYASVVVRYVDPADCKMTVLHLGVSLFVGKHDPANIVFFLRGRLAYSSLAMSDVCSTTTDSGSNVRKACVDDMEAPSLPCFAHSMHNAVQYSLGWTSSRPQGDLEDADGIIVARRDRRRIPRTRALLARMRKLTGHFNHSERSAAIFHDLDVPQQGDSRDLITDVVTSWGSTYRAISRNLTLYDRLAAFFASPQVGSSQRRRRLTSANWDRLRPILGVLSSAFEVTTAAEVEDDALIDLVSLLGFLRIALNSPTVTVPCQIAPALAVGDRAIEAYCDSNPTGLTFEFDNYLFPAEELYVDDEPGKESRCTEAAAVVMVLREQLDPRLFNVEDPTRNVLKNHTVLRPCILSPGGVSLLRKLSELVNQPDPYGAAVASVRELCKSLAPSSIPSASATLAAAPPPSRRRARSSLIDLLIDGSNSAAVQQQSPSSMAFAELEAFLQLAEIIQKQQPQHVWRGYKEQFPVLYLVACCSIGAVASSAASERDFPTAGAVMRKNSTRLLPQQLEMQCFIHDNVDLLPKPIEAVPAMTNQQANQVRAAMPMAGRQQDLEDDINTSADEE